jgi:hypothetical protein
MGKSPTQNDYVMDVLLRKFCRTTEENDILYEEIDDLRTVLKNLFQENADLRHQLKEAGIEAAPSEFIIMDDDEELDETGDVILEI